MYAGSFLHSFIGSSPLPFLDYYKLGEYIMQEREGEFMYDSFVCMEDGCDVMEILHEKSNEIDFGGM